MGPSRRTRPITAIALLLLAAGCPRTDADTPDGGVPDGGGTDFAFCARQRVGTDSTGATVPFCDELFLERPWVHLPPDRLTGSLDLFAAYVVNTNLLVLRDDVRISLADGDAAAATIANNRSVFTIWRLSGGSIESGPEGRVLRGARASPALILSAEALESRFGGAWEGTLTPRDPAGSGLRQWAGTPVPIRLSFDALGELVPVYRDGIEGSGPELPEGATHQMVGRVDNYDAPVTSATGGCLAALSSLGDANPLLGLVTEGSVAPNDVRLYRFLSMHAPFDDHAFMDPGYLMDTSDTPSSPPTMGAMHPVNYIQDAERPDWSELHTITVHGTPTGFQVQYLRRVTGGGSGC